MAIDTETLLNRIDTLIEIAQNNGSVVTSLQILHYPTNLDYIRNGVRNEADMPIIKDALSNIIAKASTSIAEDYIESDFINLRYGRQPVNQESIVDFRMTRFRKNAKTGIITKIVTLRRACVYRNHGSKKPFIHIAVLESKSTKLSQKGHVITTVNTNGKRNISTNLDSHYHIYNQDQHSDEYVAEVVIRKALHEDVPGINDSPISHEYTRQIQSRHKTVNTEVWRHYVSNSLPSRYPTFPCSTQFFACFTDITTAHELTANLFGKRKVRRDLIRAVANATLLQLEIAWALNNKSVKVDWIVHFLSQSNSRELVNHIYNRMPRGEALLRPRVKKMFRSLDDNTRHHLLITPLTKVDAYVSIRDLVSQIECARAANDALPKKLRRNITISGTSFAKCDLAATKLVSERCAILREHTDKQRAALQERRAEWLLSPAGIAWQEQRDAAERERQERLRREHAERVVMHRSVTQKITNLNLTDIDPSYRVIVATNQKQLIEWANTMGNCIGYGGYGDSLRNASSVLFAIYVGDKMFANGEIYTGGATPLLTQLYGKRNNPLSDEIDKPIRNAIKALGIAV